LNEKRPEIAKIELKQRINVLLVPNKSLETPHYKLERLKHDDPRLDNIQASYKMAEEIEDPTAVTRRSQEPTNKQTPVIKGVLPDLPAPPAEARPPRAERPVPAARREATVAPAEKGFFGWLKGLFSSEPAAAPAPAPAGRGKPGERREPGRDGARGEGRGDGRRGGRRGEGRGGERTERGEGRGERTERPDGRNAEGRAERGERGEGRSAEGRNTEGRAERGERGGRNGRGERSGEARNRPEARTELRTDDARSSDAPSTETLDANGEKAARPARGEGRRGRGRRGERSTPTGDNQTNEDGLQQLAAPSEASADGAPHSESSQPGQDGEALSERRERRSRDRYGRDRQPRDNQADSASTAEHSPVEVHEQARAHAPVAAPAAARMPTVGAYELPISSLQGVAQSSGLEWVNSNPERIAQVQAAIAAEPRPMHVPRERPPVVVMDEGPLILVETKRDLGQMPMPFDNSASH
jgi:ribonuclease E